MSCEKGGDKNEAHIVRSILPNAKGKKEKREGKGGKRRLISNPQVDGEEKREGRKKITRKLN